MDEARSHRVDRSPQSEDNKRLATHYNVPWSVFQATKKRIAQELGKEYNREQNRLYYEKNREKRLEYFREYYKKNQDKRKEYQKLYRKKNQEKVAMYRKKNADKRTAYMRAWRESILSKELEEIKTKTKGEE